MTYSPYLFLPRVLALLIDEGHEPQISGENIDRAVKSAAELLDSLGVQCDPPERTVIDEDG